MNVDIRRRVGGWARSLGPGLITGTSDDDPSGIATYSIAGASAGFSMLWAALVTTPMLGVLDGTCARIALATRAGLMSSLMRSMPRIAAMALALLIVFANTFNIGADLEAMAAAAHLLLRFIPEEAWLFALAGCVVAVEVFFDYRQFANVMRWLCVSLFAYVVSAFIVHVNWLDVLWHTIVPEVRWSGAWFTTLTATLGTTITPYLFFWQTSMTAEEVRARREPETEDVSRARVAAVHADANTGAIYSNAVAIFIIVTCAATIGAHGAANITTAQDAAQALRPLAGDFAFALFTLGIVGTGLLAVPVLAGASGYMVAEIFGLHEGLDTKPRRARGFYGVIVFGVFAGVLMGVMHFDPIKALFWSAVFNGVAAVPLLYAVIRISRDPRILGALVVSRAAIVWLWLALALMVLSAAGMAASWFMGAA
ncbi:MAG TPA: divalent metal cation transporter [Candidatus Acidoferrales bacterium]|nr:divalent metal cation transporter [Candidatus Acidoferrales bacterium]